MIFDPQLLIEISEFATVKLLSVVRDNHPRNPKSTYDVLLDEVLYLGFCGYRERLCFHPLSKIINSDNKNLTCFLLGGRGPTMSIPHVENGHCDEIFIMCSVGTCCTFPNC